MRKMLKKIVAFSMVELIFGLVVVSVLLAAFAPQMSKRMSSSSKGGSAYRACSHQIEDCEACYNNECVFCNKACSENEVLIVAECKCRKCSERITNCIECDTSKCTKCVDGYYVNAGVCTICPAGYKCFNGNRVICPKGTYAPRGSSYCTTCKSGYIAANAGSASCTICPDGKYTLDNITCLNCPAASSVDNALEYVCRDGILRSGNISN